MHARDPSPKFFPPLPGTKRAPIEIALCGVTWFVTDDSAQVTCQKCREALAERALKALSPART